MGDIQRAVALLRQGELVALPTETVYGLGADALNPDAVAKIFAAKGRPSDHPLIVQRDCDMAGPEQQVVAADIVRGAGKGVFLHVAVAGAGDGAGGQGGLRQTRAIDPPATVAAPQIGRADQASGDGGGVPGRLVRDMLERHPSPL